MRLQRLETLTNKDDKKDIYKKTFDKIVKEKLDEIRELGDEVDHDYLTS